MRHAIAPAQRPMNREQIKQIEATFNIVTMREVTVTEEVKTTIRDAIQEAQMKLIETKQDNERIEFYKWALK
jgi:hypothetical protein